MQPQRVLWYFADPMCSWCWGFAPVISAVMDGFRDRLMLALVMGGLRPGTTQPMTPEARAEILHHWAEVERRSGQPFKRDGALPDGFVYDTEPACRAVVTMLDIDPPAALAYFKSVQAAFYAEGRDVTEPQTLATLAEQQGVDPARFSQRFASDEMAQTTRTHFHQTAQIGVRGFPTVILQNDDRFEVLTYGYRPLEEIEPMMHAWFAQDPPSASATNAEDR